MASSGSRYQSTELTLKRQIDEMEVEMRRVVEERQLEGEGFG